MLKFVENAYFSLQEKEREKQVELQRSRQINEQLKEKLKKLETENRDLREKFTENEIDVITRKNELNTLLETLQRERRAALEESQRLQIAREQIDSCSVLEESQRLQIAREQIDSISELVEELRPIKEQLDFKQNVTECLHDLLIKTKLRIAESEDTLQELHDYFTQLEYDIEKTKEIQKQGCGHWQEEFLAARLREADVILEFDKLKREIATIKSELEEKILIEEARRSVSRSPESSTSTSWGRSSIPLTEQQQALLLEEEISIANTVELQNEVDFLRHQLRKLEDQKKDCEVKIKINDDTKVHLHEVRRSIWLREFETTQKTDSLREKYARLADKMSQELARIQESIENKDLVVATIEEKIKEAEALNESLEDGLKNQSGDDAAAGELEEKKNKLEEEIDQLKKT